nr:methyltransferase-like protein 7A [Parasteatoda tepidariorum]XP_042903360.1 methyltransferase-like protein 7A [Parasteatoda tepidariorum]
MEAVVYLIFTAIWWMTSLSALLPFVVLLILSKTFRDKWFSFVFSKVCGPLFGPRFASKRKQLFELLEEHLSKSKKSAPLKVLEIGIGAGANLQFYPENSNLTALDMNPSFIQHFNKNRKNYPQVNLDEIIVNYAEDMKDVPSDAFDVVVCTHVLCSVESMDSVMKEVKRVLKPGGKFIFMEHVRFPKTKASYLVQLFAAPLWKIYFNGCCLDRNTADFINKAGFTDVHCEVTYSPTLPLFFRPHISGIATK